MTEATNGYMPDTRSPWTRWLDRLFPFHPCDCPDARDVSGAGDVIVCRTAVRVSWPDVLRLVLTRRMVIETKTATDHLVGRTSTCGSVSVVRNFDCVR